MANLIHVNRSATPVTFRPATQTPDVTFELDGIADGAGQVSDAYDLGANGSRRWIWHAWIQCQATPVVGQAANLLLRPVADATPIGGALTADDLHTFLSPFGQVPVHVAAADTEFSLWGELLLPYRYIQIGIWNATGAALTADETEHGVELYAVPDRIEDSA